MLGFRRLFHHTIYEKRRLSKQQSKLANTDFIIDLSESMGQCYKHNNENDIDILAAPMSNLKFYPGVVAS